MKHYHGPHAVDCDGQEILLVNGESVPCLDQLPLEPRPDTAPDPWADPKYVLDADWDCADWHGDACLGIHHPPHRRSI